MKKNYKNRLIITFIILLCTSNLINAQVPFCPEEAFADVTTISGNSSNDIVLLNNKIYSINPFGSSPTLNEFNIATGVVTIINQPNFKLGETSLTEYAGNLYAFGGYTGSSASALAKKYNLNTNSWESLPNMPVSLIQTSAVTVNNYIYITGGTFGTTKQYFLKFDPSTKTYTTLATPIINRVNSKLVVYNNTIYCLGGHFYNGSTMTSTNDFSTYNESSNSWQKLANMPFALSKTSATIWGGYLYVFGGVVVTGNAFATFTWSYKYFVYDFANKTWSTSTKTMEKPIEGGSVSLNNTIYFVTGNSITKYYCSNTCTNYITVTDTLIINIGQLSNTNPIAHANNITIYPNPASTEVNISFNNITDLNGGTLKIINSLGQQVATTPITATGTNTTMALSTWGGSGLYFVQIINNQGKVVNTKKIILQ